MYTQLCTLVFFLLFAAGSLSAQSALLTGRVLDPAGDPLAYANVLLLATADSSLVQGELAVENGQFRLQVTQPGAYLLQISMIGYTSHTQPIDLAPGAELALPTCTLAPAATTLATVEVTARKPFLEQQAGKLVVNVAESLTGQSGSTIDLLRKVPGLLVVRDQVSLAGQTGVSILIDGRPTRYLDMASLLREMPASDIARIEVISQPGAAYDAEGSGGVINIILKKNVQLGTNGTATAGLGYGWREKARASLSINHRAGPLNLHGGAGFSRRTNYERLLLDRQVDSLGYRQQNFSPALPLAGAMRLGADYDLNDRQRIGVNLRANGSVNRRTDRSLTFIQAPQWPVAHQLDTDNQRRSEWRSLAADAYYTFTFDTTGRKLNTDLSYVSFARTGSNLALTTAADANYPGRRNEETGATHILAVKADYTHPLHPNWQLESGVKYSYAFVDNNLDAFSRNHEAANWEVAPHVGNHFQYTERLGAAYLSLKWQRGKLQANAGLRYEHTDPQAHNLTLDSLIRQPYGGLFPSFNLAGPLAMQGKLGWNVAYSYRLQRPSYHSLNPFVVYMDPFTYQRGNPYLQPEFTHSVKGSVSYERQPFFNLEYSRTRGSIQLVTEQDQTTGATFAYHTNLDELERYGGSLFFPLMFIAKGVGGYAGVMAHYQHYRTNYLGNRLDQGQWNVKGYLQLTYQLPGEIKAELSGWYSGGGREGLTTFEPLYSFSLGFEKKIFHDQATIGLSFDDFFYRYWHGNLQFAHMDIDIQSQWETQVVNLSFRYQFGNRYLKARENRRTGSQEEESRAQVKG